MSNFNKACRRYLTKEENELLSYEQKVQLLNLTVKQQKSDRKYEKHTGKGDPADIGDTLKDVCDTVNSLPMTDRQKEIARFKYMKYTIEEISQLLSVSDATINRELIIIKQVMDNNRDMLEVEYDTWNKKTSSYNE